MFSTTASRLRGARPQSNRCAMQLLVNCSARHSLSLQALVFFLRYLR